MKGTSTSSLPPLILEWERPGTGDRFRIAELRHSGGEWCFQYEYEIEPARRAGLDHFGGFPLEREEPETPESAYKPFESKTLFPSIRRRIPDLRRSDVQRLLRDYQDRGAEEQYYWYLRLYGGRQPADPFRFVTSVEATRGAAPELDRAVRNELRKVVAECRELLLTDLAEQLEGRYGIHRASGTLEPIGSLRLDLEELRKRHAIEAAVTHEQTTLHSSAQEAVERFLREATFTILNRLAALKLMEHPTRAVIRESIGGGRQSKGVKQFQMVCPEVCRAAPDGGYQRYLEFLYDDLAAEMAVLWDRSLPTSALFPSPACLDAVTGLLNDSTIAEAWGHDETIGWVYQYFTPKELRDQTRKASPAPRNSYELAFLNQFYTPAYVVQFLVDNTLGRLWVEMRGGQTSLLERCTYLVRRPDAPASGKPRKDPRNIAILDPACGSGHFLLYAFELLRWIYLEAYEDPEVPRYEATGRTLRADYPDPEAFRAAISGLILQHNLHGIDIDLRATQIAALALWLRAQRLAAELSPKGPHQPVTQIHVVCAEPMPGEEALFEEFLRTLHPPLLQQVAREVWRVLGLAADVGSLLKVEVTLRQVILEARRQWQTRPPSEQFQLFPGARPAATQIALDLSGITDRAFWDQAEQKVLEAFRQYAEQAGNSEGVARRIFAEDGAQGFRLVDLMLKSYDVVLMNPPFGAPSVPSRAYIHEHYPQTRNDLYAAFVERGLELLRPAGLLGAITSRTGFFLTSFAQWREDILLQQARLLAVADLGYGVLDTAMVETAAYVLEKVNHSLTKG